MCTRNPVPTLLFAALLALGGPLLAAADEAFPAAENENPSHRFAQIERALTGTGNQSQRISGAAQTGSGFQDNAAVDASGWSGIDSANAGTGAQIKNSMNANGRDRISSDTVLHLPDAIEVTNASLRSRVANNSVDVTQTGGAVNSSLVIRERAEWEWRWDRQDCHGSRSAEKASTSTTRP